MKKTILALAITFCLTSYIRAGQLTENSSLKRQKEERHIVTIDIESSGTIIVGNIKFTADSPQRSKNLSRAVSAYGEETVVDIRPAKYTPMKHVYDVLIAIGGSGCYKFILEGREYEIPAKLNSPQVLTIPIEVLLEIGPPVEDPASGQAIHAGEVMCEGMVFSPSADLSALTKQLRSFQKAFETSQSMLITSILTEDETLYGRVVHVLDACAEAGNDNISFSIALEPREDSAPSKNGRKKIPAPRRRRRIVSESSKSKLVMPELTGVKRSSNPTRDTQASSRRVTESKRLKVDRGRITYVQVDGKVTFKESLECADKLMVSIYHPHDYEEMVKILDLVPKGHKCWINVSSSISAGDIVMKTPDGNTFEYEKITKTKMGRFEKELRSGASCHTLINYVKSEPMLVCRDLKFRASGFILFIPE